MKALFVLLGLAVFLAAAVLGSMWARGWIECQRSGHNPEEVLRTGVALPHMIPKILKNDVVRANYYNVTVCQQRCQRCRLRLSVYAVIVADPVRTMDLSDSERKRLDSRGMIFLDS